MAIQKITIQQLLELSPAIPIFDVRSPGEFVHAHIPNAISLPLFSDEERKVVGTAYKQESKQVAVKIGLDYFGVKMRAMVEEVEAILATLQKSKQIHPDVKEQTIIVHCWRGGMRSAGVAWLLDLYGYKVFTIIGGYKAYRRWAIEQFEISYPLYIIGGYTGSGKTKLLHALQDSGEHIIDLEKLANHKGSAFGWLGEDPPPSQEMFENILAKALYKVYSSIKEKKKGNATILIEDESQRIGKRLLPNAFWKTMRNSPLFFLDIPFEERLKYITEQYSQYDRQELIASIVRIQRRLGGLETKTAVNHLLDNNYTESFRILLYYYDKLYNKSLHNREDLAALLHKIPCESMELSTMIEKLKEAMQKLQMEEEKR